MSTQVITRNQGRDHAGYFSHFWAFGKMTCAESEGEVDVLGNELFPAATTVLSTAMYRRSASTLRKT